MKLPGKGSCTILLSYLIFGLFKMKVVNKKSKKEDRHCAKAVFLNMQ